MESDKSGKITGINSKKAKVEILSITNDFNTGKQIVETLSSFEMELSDFVFAQRYVDSDIQVDKVGARGGFTEKLNTWKMKDPF